jgi:hypothetical protein
MYPIAKHGRSSGWITGTLNAAKSCLRVKNDDTTLSFVFETGPTVDTVIVHSLICHTTGESIMDRRDSGSLILLNQPEQGQQARALGLSFFRTESTGISYTTSMEVAVADIEDITGGKVVYLVKVEDEKGAPFSDRF